MRWIARSPLIAAISLLCLLVAPGYVLSQEVLESPKETLDSKTAYEKKLSEIPITVEGSVVTLLDDDLQGKRHQRFILRTDEGQRLMIAHNIDIAPRVPLQVGAKIRVRGVYLWNIQGGIIHKTHHDPQGQGAGGWIEILSTGKRYE